MTHEFKDIREFFTAIGEHACSPEREITVKDIQGTTRPTTFVGFACSCGEHFLCSLMVIGCAMKPMRPYVMNRTDRIQTAERLTRDPAALLAEMRTSGGWNQLDPGVVMMTALAAACGPKGNPMEQRLHAMMKGEKPS